MLVGELQNLRWDVICFSETRAASADVILDGGHRLITGLGDSRHEGVAVLLHASLADKVKRINIFSGRVMSIKINIGYPCTIVSSYAPHCG